MKIRLVAEKPKAQGERGTGCTGCPIPKATEILRQVDKDRERLKQLGFVPVSALGQPLPTTPTK